MNISWDNLEPDTADDADLLSLLKYFLRQMIPQFGATGACIALLEEDLRQMRIRVHMRLGNAEQETRPIALRRKSGQLAQEFIQPPFRRTTINLLQDSADPAAVEIEDVLPEQSALFAVETCYTCGQDLIGLVWQRNGAYVLSQEEYAALRRTHSQLMPGEITPTAYLAAPIREATVADKVRPQHRESPVIGVIVLYQTSLNGTPFQQYLFLQLQQYIERMALYLQNDRLQRSQLRTNKYLQLLQRISTIFPNSVQLADLVENVYQFASRVVDLSNMLLTIYDRDLDRLYDVFAVRDGQHIDGLTEQPLVRLRDERPVWWQVVRHEKEILQFSPAQEPQKREKYEELLMGVCGDQRQIESFILLPMKMFTRVIGSLSISSTRPHAYQPDEVQVLKTMAQIVAVNIENAKLYERDRQIIQAAIQREEELAEINDSLQAISSTLNVTELATNLVESMARMLKVKLCVFFQPSPDRDVFIAQALYAPSNVQMFDDGSGLPDPTPPKGVSDQFITMIELPSKECCLGDLSNIGFRYLDPPQLEELAQKSSEAGAIFLRETGLHSMLVVPMNYQMKLLGFLGIATPSESTIFRPKEVGTVLAICAQAASGIRNAQLFEETQEAYAELERLNKLKDEFLITASHELRTPLTAIHGNASRLKRKAARATPQEVLHCATQISVAAQQLGDLISNMTEAAQIGAMEKDRDLHIEPVQVLAAAKSARNMLPTKDDHKIVLHIPPDLCIHGDAHGFRRILTILLENAAKYSPPQTVITVSAEKMLLSEVQAFLSEDQIDHTLLVEQEDRAIVLVRVNDQGMGVIPEDQLRIFEKFVRAPRSLTTPVRGSGLGLFTARRFTEAMDGKLWLEETIPNEGATFSFYLPWIDTPPRARFDNDEETIGE